MAPADIFYVVLLIGGVILVHELGHFLVARWMGIHVVEFSIGFGPRIAVFRGKKRHPHLPPTEYALAILPFGGFVRMLGYDPGDKVPEGAEDVAFGRKPVWRRFLVMVAGPAFNLILPFILFFAVGLTVERTGPSIVSDVDSGGPAYVAGIRSGDRIVEIEGEQVDYWWQLTAALHPRYEQPTEVAWVDVAGQRKSATVTPMRQEVVIVPDVFTYPVGLIGLTEYYFVPIVWVRPESAAAQAGIASWDRIIEVDGQPVAQVKAMLALLDVGAGKDIKVRYLHYDAAPTGTPFAVDQGTLREAVLPAVPAGGDARRGLVAADRVVWRTMPGSPAEEIGLQQGDELVSLDGREWDSATFAQGYLDSRKGKGAIKLIVRRGGQLLPLDLTLKQVDAPHEIDKTAKDWVHGIVVQSTATKLEPIPNEARFAFAWHSMKKNFVDTIENTVKTLGGLLTGKVSMSEGLGGPLSIAKMASFAGSQGWDKFFSVMAMISISIGLVNLLPIPVLDGGQILFLALEGIRRKPVSMRTRMIAIYASLAFIIVLMVIVIRNDVLKISG